MTASADPWEMQSLTVGHTSPYPGPQGAQGPEGRWGPGQEIGEAWLCPKQPAGPWWLYELSRLSSGLFCLA